MKRVFDFIISLLAIIILLPVFLIVGLVLKFTGEGEVFYLQPRIGYRNKEFKMWKFVTMVKNSPSMGTGDVTLRSDPRVLPFGKWLRKTKINELPQFINVVKGEMSLVGARPIMQPSFELYSNEAKQTIYNSPPGVTGIASLIFRDEESMIANSDLPPLDFYREHIIPYKNKLDIWYQNNKSLWTDIKILFLTVWAILIPDSQLIEKVFDDLPTRPF